MKNVPTSVSPYAITDELQAAIDAAEAASAKCKKLTEEVDSSASVAVGLDSRIARLTAELAAEQGEMALCEDAEVKGRQEVIERLAAELEQQEREARRVRAKIRALEEMAPTLDEMVAVKGAELRRERSIWMQSIMPALSLDLSEAAKPLLGFMATVRAINASISGPELLDFLGAAYVPDPLGFVRYMTPGNGWYNQGVNLLDGSDSTQTIEVDRLAARLMPVKAAIAMANAHRPYVPLTKRPVPYVKKGYLVEGADYFARKRAAAGSLDKPVGLSAQSAPTPQELNLGPALAENFDRPSPQEQL